MTAPDVDDEDHPLPLWARITAYLGGATVGAAALAASGIDLYHLAIALGFAFGVALAVPIGLDAGASTTAVLWITSPKGSPVRKQWRNATFGFVGASAALNGLSVLAAPHWLANALREVADVSLLPAAVAVVVAVLIAVAFPLVAAWMVHAVLYVRDKAARHRRPRQPRRRWLRELVAAWAEHYREAAEDRREARALRELERAALETPGALEDEQEPPSEQHPEDEPRGELEDAPDADPDDPTTDETPALSGNKTVDAKNWARLQWDRGENPRLAHVNRHVGSDSLVKRREFDGWRAEWEAEQSPEHTPQEPVRLHVAGRER